MSRLYKIIFWGGMSFLFLGCTSKSDIEYVRVTQLEAIKKEIEILKTEKSSFDEKYKLLYDAIDKNKEEEGDEKDKIEFIEKEVNKLKSDFEEIKQDFEENKALAKIQLKEIETVLSNLKKVKDQYLEDVASSTKNLSSLKNSASKKIINLEEEAKKIRENNNSSNVKEKTEDMKKKLREELPEDESKTKDFVEEKKEEVKSLTVSFIEEKTIAGKDFVVFNQCNEKNVCKNYLVEKKFFSNSMIFPKKSGEKYLISGTTKFLGKVSEEDYFIILDKFSLEKVAIEKSPQKGISPFSMGVQSMDNLMK